MGVRKERDPQDRINEKSLKVIVTDKTKVFLKGSKVVKKELLDNYNRTNNKIYQSIIRHVTELKNSLIKESDYPLYLPEKNHRQLKLFSSKGYVDANDQEFNQFLNKRNFEALIYEITCHLPYTWYNNKCYIGFTGRPLKIRFREHIERAIRECVRTNNTPSVGYTKLYQAIANSIIEVGWNIGQVYEQLRILTGQDYYKFLYNVVKSIKGKYIIPKVIELHEYEDTAHEREKYLTKTLNTVKEGLNEKEGGGAVGKYIRLPLYDMAVMIALGKNKAQISRLIRNFYNIEVSEETIKKRISDIFGGWYEAQIKFLKPIVEKLFLDGYNGRQIYELINDISGQHQDTWFNDWIWGETFLNFEINEARKVLIQKGIENPDSQTIYEQINKHYFGFLQSQWIKWAIENVSFNYLAKKYNFSKKTLVKIYEKIGNSHTKVQIKYRRLKAKELLRKNWKIEKIYTEAFKKSLNSPPKAVKGHSIDYFENILFPFSTVESIYRNHNSNLLREYLEEKEKAETRPSKRMGAMQYYPKDLDTPFPQDLIDYGYFSLKKNKNQIKTIPSFLRYVIVGIIYKYLKENPSISIEKLLYKIYKFAEKHLARLTEALNNPKYSKPLKEYLTFFIYLIREIKRRKDNSEPLYRTKIIMSLKENNIKPLVSPPLINDIIWNLKYLFPADFENS